MMKKVKNAGNLKSGMMLHYVDLYNDQETFGWVMEQDIKGRKMKNFWLDIGFSTDAWKVIERTCKFC